METHRQSLTIKQEQTSQNTEKHENTSGNNTKHVTTENEIAPKT